MNYYQHHIGDFNSATMCLTRVERSLYRDLIELYYSKEKPLTSDLRILKKLAMVRTDEEESALNLVLELFFELDADGFYHNKRCDEELERYKSNSSAKARAGKASAAARKQKAQAEKEQNQTDAKQVLDSVGTECQQNPTNQEPVTKNQEPIISSTEKNQQKKWQLPDWINPNSWKEFEQHRRDMRQPLTDLARTKAANTLKALTFEQQQACIDMTIQNRWKGLFPEQHKTKPQEQLSGNNDNWIDGIDFNILEDML